MTEAEWLAATDPLAMLAFLRDSGRASDRKLRKFGLACLRQAWPRLTDKRDRHEVVLGEWGEDRLSEDVLAFGSELEEAQLAPAVSWVATGYPAWLWATGASRRAAAMAGLPGQ
jgi:hypothetical protein